MKFTRDTLNNCLETDVLVHGSEVHGIFSGVSEDEARKWVANHNLEELSSQALEYLKSTELAKEVGDPSEFDQLPFVGFNVYTFGAIEFYFDSCELFNGHIIVIEYRNEQFVDYMLDG